MSLYRLNKDYIHAFQQNVLNRFNKEDKKSDVFLLKSILYEITNLFKKLGNQISSKANIPKADDYPKATKHNALLEDICFDIDKLYNAQLLVESDTKDLVNFNSSLRDRIFENIVSIQQLVYSAYVKSKKDIIGGTEVPSERAFVSAESLGDGSENVFIDEDRGVLTLSFEAIQERSVDINHVAIYFSGTKPQGNYYPGSHTMGVGSHWKKEITFDPHFICQSNPTEVLNYKKMLIDDPDNNTSVGFCEFEIVRTIDTINKINNTKESQIVKKVEEFLSKHFPKDHIRIDKLNSFQGKYIDDTEPIHFTGSNKYKLVIPFTTSLLTDEIIVELNSVNGYYPRVLWNESFIFTNSAGTDVSFKLIDPRTQPKDGRVVCKIQSFVLPTRLELMLEYSGESMIWNFFPFVMARYSYFDYLSYALPSNTTTNVQTIAKKEFDIFVDAEADRISERTRAKNVLINPNRG